MDTALTRRTKRAGRAAAGARPGREIAQVYRTPGGALFRSSHPNYGDLYRATDRLEVDDVSPMNFDEARSRGEDAGAAPTA